MIEKPDKSFSPERNKAVIEETMRETDKYFKSLEYQAMKNMGESIDVMASFWRYKFARSGSKSIEDYLGPEITKRIIGEKLTKKIQILKAADKLKKLANPTSTSIIT